MTPTNVVLDRLAELLATDATTLAPAALAVHVHLAKAPFTPAGTRVVADFVEADFAGYAPLDAGVGPQQNFIDPSNGNRTVQLVEPPGGWHWQASGVGNLPQTIYGYYVSDNADAVLFGSKLIQPPIPLAGILDGVDLAQVRFQLLTSGVI